MGAESRRMETGSCFCLLSGRQMVMDEGCSFGGGDHNGGCIGARVVFLRRGSIGVLPKERKHWSRLFILATLNTTRE